MLFLCIKSFAFHGSETFKLQPDAYISHSSIDGSPYLSGIKTLLPGVGRSADGILDGVVGEVLTADVDGEAAEFAGYLCLQLEVGRIAGVVVELATTFLLLVGRYVHACQ